MYTNVMEAGAKAVILVSASTNAGKGSQAYLLRTMPGYKKTLPLNGVEIKRSSTIGKLVIDEKREDVYVSLTHTGNYQHKFIHIFISDINDYTKLMDSGAMTAMKVIFQIFGCGTLLFASWKLYGYIKFFGLQVSPPQICLTIEILGSIGTNVISIFVDHFRTNHLHGRSFLDKRHLLLFGCIRWYFSHFSLHVHYHHLSWNLLGYDSQCTYESRRFWKSEKAIDCRRCLDGNRFNR